MANNKLRRELDNYVAEAFPIDVLVPKALLRRALAALGGPVAAPTPPIATAPMDAPHPADIAPALDPIIGNDPGDESEHVSGLGDFRYPIATAPADIEQ